MSSRCHHNINMGNNLGILEFQILVAGEPIYGYIKIYLHIGIKANNYHYLELYFIFLYLEVPQWSPTLKEPSNSPLVLRSLPLAWEPGKMSLPRRQQSL